MRRPPTLETLAVALLVLSLAQPTLAPLFDAPALQTFTTLLLALVVQALPFLVVGVALAAAVSAWLPASLLSRWRPGPGRSVPIGAASGFALPGCECGSVPLARRLIGAGVPRGAALAFMLSAPAINPVVLAATAVAFAGQPDIVVARAGASLVAATVVGLVWQRWAKPAWTACTTGEEHHDAGGRWQTFVVTLRDDGATAGGFLVVGAAAAAAIQTFVPASWIETVAGHEAAAIATMAALAVLLSVCSEADAFIAASLTQFSRTAQLTFMVVSPFADLKILALQAGVFGRRFVLRFAPLAIGTAVAAAVAAGALLGW